MDLEPGQQTWPEATQIVDYYHAREHVNDLAKRLIPVLGDDQHAWLQARLEDLDEGDIEAFVAATRALPISDTDRDQVDTALDYFIRNAQRMRYKVFRDLGMFIGSGVDGILSGKLATYRVIHLVALVVEAGCKSVG